MAGDTPEGFAVVAIAKAKGLRRRTRMLVSAAFVLPVLSGCRELPTRAGSSRIVQFSPLAFTAGVLMTVRLKRSCRNRTLVARVGLPLSRW
jgi:zinc transporter ZupT